MQRTSTFSLPVGVFCLVPVILIGMISNMKIAITGASRGIGLSTAQRLSADNELYLTASSTDSFKEHVPRAIEINGDLSTLAGVDIVANSIMSQTDTLDVLFNNVGVMIMKKFEDMTPDDINHLLNLNLRSHLLLTRQLLPLLVKSENPQIIFMSSMAAKSSIVGESVYAATKSAITGFANVLRNELGGRVRVTAIHAWGTNTFGADESEPLIEPKDIGEVVEFIINRPNSMMVESIDLSNPRQWRGAQAPWSP